jgi:uncharacterized protein (UPF0264 family)
LDYALSLKQPWAALLVHGLKKIEVRRWSTLRRGRVLIHAARLPDMRREAWAHVTPGVEATALLRGGIIGAADLVDCMTYSSRTAFNRQRGEHLNEPGWFTHAPLFGFVFRDATLLPFQRCAGALHFFPVEVPVARIPKEVGLLVSVRCASEAAAACEGGAALVDIKEPRRGPLGAADDDVLRAVVEEVAGRRPISAAWGELAELRQLPRVPGLAYVKCGLAGLGRRGNWRRQLDQLRARVSQLPMPPTVVTVAYADWQRAAAPPWFKVVDFALQHTGGPLLLDTFDKAPRQIARQRRPATLLDCLAPDELRRLCERCHAAGVQVALAGSLRLPQIVQLLETRPTWFAVRGAVCDANDRDGAVHVLKVLDLAELLRWKPQAARRGS